MKMRFLIVGLVLLGALGCKGLKDSQLGAYVGNSQTKVFYKNVGGNADKVPEGSRVYFKTSEEASGAGYSSVNEAGAEKAAGGEDEN